MRTMVLAALGWLAAAAAGAQDGSNGPGIENVARPAGTFLSYHPLGGRMVTFHRGYLYIMGQAKTTLWDVSSFTDPVVLDIKEIGDNGHRWWKFNTDMFWREYTTPEVDGSGYHFLDMSNMFDLKPWTDPSVPMPIEEGGQQLQFEWQALETWPTGTNGGNVHDARYDNPQEGGITSTFDTASLGVNSMLRFRIGNLLFITAPNGLAVLDIGDPKNVVFLDSIICDCEQYTTTYHVWGDHLVVLNGNNNNEGGNNLVTIDFSDPTDLKLGSVALPVEVVSAGRYMYFQDEYGFAGQDAFGVKVDMRTGEIVQRFDAPGPWPQTFLDYQWMPLGAVVVSSGSNSDDGKTFFYQHQDQPDTRGPTIRFHHPFADSTNNPVSTVIGFAIPEIIDERTANNDTIILRPVGGGEPIPADFIWSSYQVLNMVPRRLLDPDTTYEVRFVAGGLKDVAGNGIEEYSFFFSTGNALNPNTAPKVEAVEYGGDGPVALGQSVTFTAVASDFENDPIEYRWNVDGGANTTWSSDNRFTVSFDTLGVHSVTVQVRDDQGGLSAFSRNVVVVSSTTPSTATQSAPLALDAVGRKVWVVNPDNDTVTAVHADTLAKIGEYPVCAHPSSVAVDGHGQVWVTCRDADQVQVLDGDTGASVSVLELPYGAQPYGLVVDPAGDQVYVGLAGRGAVTRIDAAARSVGPSVSLGPQVRALAISPDGSRLLATRFISPDDGGRVWEVDLASFTLSRTFTLPLDSTTPDSGNAGRGLPNYLASVAFAPDGGRAIVVGKKDNILRGLARDGNPLTFETTVRNTIATLDMATGSERVDERLDIDNHAQPSAVTFSPLGTHVFIAMQGNNRVVVLDATSGREVGRVDVGLAPQGVLVDPATNRVFVKNFTERSLTVLDGAGMLARGEQGAPVLATVTTVAQERLSAQQLLGLQIFYNARDTRMGFDGYISCSACHNDGDEDGRVWDFTDRGEGLRNTIALRGRAGTGHGRVHWSGNFDEIQDFEHDIRGPFAGTGFMSDADFNAGTRNHPLGDAKAGVSAELDALAAYVATFDRFDRSPYRNADGTLTTDAQAGRVLFENAGCANCHGGPDFSDSERGLMHDVGTIKPPSGGRLGEALLGIDTPTLRDVWATAPYFHDGSAATLEDVLLNNPNDAHGVTSNLSAAEIAQLAAYLRQIDGSEPGFAPGIEFAISTLADGDSVRQGELPLAVSTNIPGISEVVYYADGEAVARSSVGPGFATSWTPPQLGDYRIVARAVYNNGATATLSPELRVNYGGSNVCHVHYDIPNDWGAGFQVEITITNGSDTPIAGYDLAWNMGPGEAFASGWNASYTADGSQVTASNPALAYNGTIPPGGSVSFGFQATNSSPPATVPTDFRLNGIPCSTGEQPPASSSSSSVSSSSSSVSSSSSSSSVSSSSSSVSSSSSSSSVSSSSSSVSSSSSSSSVSSSSSSVSSSSSSSSVSSSSSSVSSSSSSSSVSSSSSSVSSSSSSSSVSSSSSSTAGGSCSYIVVNDWGGGHQASIRISNTGSAPIQGWQVSWQYSDGSSLANSWNAQVTGSNPYTAADLGWNATIAPGQSVEFGMIVNNGAGSAQVPQVSGAVCGQ